jgi:hypothetical protein
MTGGSESLEPARQATEALSALGVLVLACGPVMALDSRRAIDKAVVLGLAEMSRGAAPPSSSSSSSSPSELRLSLLRSDAGLRRAFVSLISRVVVVPYPDGSGSPILPLAARVLDLLCRDPEVRMMLMMMIMMMIMIMIMIMMMMTGGGGQGGDPRAGRG